MSISYDDVKDMTHFVIARTNGRVEDIREFSNADAAHEAATSMAMSSLCPGEVLVCVRYRTLEQAKHRFRHETN